MSQMPDIMSEFDELYEETISEVARRSRLTVLFLVCLLLSLFLMLSIAVSRLSTFNQVIALSILTAFDAFLLFWLFKFGVRGYAAGSTVRERLKTSLDIIDARLIAQQREANDLVPILQFVSGELRPAHYNPILERILNGRALEAGAVQPQVEFVFGPKIQSELDESDYVLDGQLTPGVLAQRNPRLADFLNRGIVQLWRLPARAPYHVALVKQHDLYIEERHEHCRPRGAFFITSAKTLSIRWRQYVEKMKQMSGESVFDEALSCSERLTARPHLVGLNLRTIVAIVVLFLCTIGVLVSSLYFQKTIIGLAIFYCSVLLAFEAFFLLREA